MKKEIHEKSREIPIHLDGKLQNLISGKSIPPFQKQRFEDVLQTPPLESLFEIVPVLQARNYIKNKLQQSSFPVIVAKFLRAAFSIEHFRWLLLPFTTTFRNYY